MLHREARMAKKKLAKRRGGSKAAARPARSRPGGKARARVRRVAVSAKKRRRLAGPKRSAPCAGAFPNAIGFTHQQVSYTTHALEDVKRFYTEVLGFREFQHDPRHEYVRVQTGPSSSLGFMPPVPGPPEQWRPPREPTLYLEVRDVDRAYRELQAKGVTFLQAPADMPWKHRVAILRDPEGRTILLAQPIA